MRLSTVIKTMAAAVMMCCSAMAQGNACELGLKGLAQLVATVVRDGNGKVQSSETAEFDRQGHLVQRTIQNGAKRTTINCEYEKGRLVRGVTDDGNPSDRTVTEFNYSAAGLLLEADEKNTAGVLISRTLSDPLRETSPAIKRTFRLQLRAPAELNDRTEMDDNDPRASVTHLMVNNKEAASWRIERDGAGRLLRDEVTYSDLSFSQREFHKDDSSLEHRFDAVKGVHTFLWRGQDGKLMKEVRSSKPEILYAYSGDERGNWTEMVEKQGKTTVGVTTRTIQYW